MISGSPRGRRAQRERDAPAMAQGGLMKGHRPPTAAAWFNAEACFRPYPAMPQRVSSGDTIVTPDTLLRWYRNLVAEVRRK